jgi:hypothetical protein
MADQGAGEGGLAGAEIAGQRDEVSRLQRCGEVGHESMQRAFACDRRRVTRSAGGGGKA